MTADAKVSDNLDYCPNYSNSSLAKRYSECSDKEEDVRQLAQDCMLHKCNRYCLKSTKARTSRTCRSHYGAESEFGKLNTPGMDLIEKAQIQINRKGISHFRPANKAQDVRWDGGGAPPRQRSFPAIWRETIHRQKNFPPPKTQPFN
jgi:hypothetical protein